MNAHACRRYAGLISVRVARIVVLLGLLFITSSQVVLAAGPNFGAYSESVEDMRIKVSGGYFLVTRTWVGNGWMLNRRLFHPYFGPEGSGNGIFGYTVFNSIIRNGDKYYRVGDTNRFTNPLDPRKMITEIESGYRWEDRAGNWITYNTFFRFLAYGDRNGVNVTARRESGGNISGFVDRNGKQFLWLEYNRFGRITAVRDYSGRRVEYRYIADSSSIDRVIDVRGNVWTYTYEGTKLKTKTDPEGRTVTINYGANRTVAGSSEEGKTFKYEYDKKKKEFYKQIRSASGRITEIWYDKEGDIFRRDVAGRTVSLMTKDGRNRIETDESGNKTRRDYDEWKNLTRIIYPDNSEETMRYDPVYSNLLEKVDANGTITRHDYDAKGNLIQTIEAAGKPEQRVTTYTYDQFGQRLTATRAADDVSAEVTRSSTYDEYGNEVTKTDGEGYTTEFTYDVMGNVLTRKDARGKIWTNTYDAAGKLTRETDPLGRITQYAYDGAGNRIQTTDAKGRVTQYLYNTQYRLVGIIDQTTASTTFQYDPDGKLLKRLDPAGKSISYSYDSSGRIRTTTDGNGNVTERAYLIAPASDAGQIGAMIYPTFTQEFRYDNRGRRIRQIDVLSSDKRLETRYEYDAEGNQTAVIDPLLRRTEFTYDAYGRLTKVTDPAGGEVIYAYDNRDNLLSVTDPETHTTSYQYDSNNRQIQEVRPEGGTITYSFNQEGDLSTAIDAKNRLARFSYDDAGHIISIAHYASATDENPAKTVAFSYDEVGNLTGYSDGTTSASYAYDANNRKIGETVNYGTFAKTLAYTYTANGLKASFTGPDGTVVRYGYDTNNQLNSVQLPIGTIITNRFDWTAPTKWTFPGGVTQERQYDPLLRPTGIRVKDQASNALLDSVYTYDDAGNIDTKQSEHGLYDYSYDSLDRLTQADTPTLPNEAYTYDGVGNRMTDNGKPGAWRYNTDNQLTNIDNQTNFTYDANGSLVQKTDNGVTTDYQYNIENRLTGITRNGSTVASYGYDPFGRRLWKEAGGQRTYFLYAEEGLIAEFDSSGTPIRQYGYKPGGIWGTDPIFQKAGGQYYFYQNDHLGTPQKLVKMNGAVVWSAKYRVFGEVQVDTGSSVENPLRFPGQYYDSESGLYYNYFRYYDPSTGRYITSDPIGLQGGLNTYLYANANPIRFIDPLGLASQKCDGDCQQSFLDCLANCIRKYDPILNPVYKAGLTAAGGTFPKRLVGLPRGLGGASQLTTVPSAAAHGLGGGASGTLGGLARGAGRIISPVWVTYGLYLAGMEVYCSATCANGRCAY